MLRRTMAVVFALVALTAGSAAAQGSCVLGVYADADGTSGYIQPVEAQNFHIYVVMNIEDTVKAVAYSLDIPGLGIEIFNLSTVYGPSGDGLNFPDAGGNNVGLGECVNGYTGDPIVVADHTMFMLTSQVPRTVTVGPNTLADEFLPIYANCLNLLLPCDIGPGLVIDGVIPTSDTSWGAVKSLFGN